MKTVIQGERGYTSICNQRGILYISLPRSVSGGKQRRITTGLSDTSANRVAATKLQVIIDSDIERNDFDITLQRYIKKHKRDDALAQLKLADVSIAQLYEEYVELRKNSTSISTHKSIYERNLKALRQCPHKNVMDASKIATWLFAKFTHDSALRTLTQINACVKWAMGVGRIPAINNPYPHTIKAAAGKKKKKKEIEFYTAEERDLILHHAAKISGGGYDIYLRLLELLFLKTGTGKHF
jgi:integrase